MYLLPKSTNGIDPCAPAYLVTRACWAAVGVWSGVYSPVAVSGMLVSSSTGVKVRYGLVYLACRNVQVGVSGSGSDWPAPLTTAECTVDRPVNVPNRLRATIMGQRSAPQEGHDSG